MKKWLKLNQKYICLFFLFIFIHWLIIFIAFLIYSKSSNNFFDFLYECYVKCGDTPHYLHIAEYGYPTSGANMNIIVFFPLYPFLMRLLNYIVHNYFISGMIISNICMGISGCLLHYYAKLELNDHNKALESVYAFMFYPFCFFLMFVFTESLFIMLSLLCLICIKKKKWLLFGIFGLLCTLTRLQGIIFIIPALYQILSSIIKEKKFDWKYLYFLIVIIIR